MSERLGQIYDGNLRRNRGTYVELNENKCEGLVPVRDLMMTTTNSTRRPLSSRTPQKQNIQFGRRYYCSQKLKQSGKETIGF